MNKQIIVEIENEEPVIIDVYDDESINVIFDTPPTKFQDNESEPVEARIRIDGLRWRNDEHFHLGWKDEEISFPNSISIKLTESNFSPSKIEKEEKYITPEEECSFCSKKKSEVKHLIKGEFFSYICESCVIECQKMIDKLNNS